ncbi:type I-F CRISPR-associated protein Csy2 [Methylotuvimicrobium sp. KM1]|uniref:type I-F CRISPR-associated protein Csy2 n=1 Tax=Methylotuvimicrobium sp. KM1 TaxID=3377707 RepID=UPI00384EDD1F
MSQYLVLSKMRVQKANCIAGFTWGFPAITQFSGFTHALQRKLAHKYDIAFSGCAVISHDYQLHVYKPKPQANFEFIQSRNPAVLAQHKTRSSPPIIEEGKMNLTVSLVIELSKELLATSEQIEAFKQLVQEKCLTSRLAGGSVLAIGQVDFLSASTQEQSEHLNRRVKRLTMPGFILQDRSDYLKQLQAKNPDAEQIDAWLDFSALKYRAVPKLKDDEEQPTEQTEADWVQVPKPFKGWLVPIMTGYKAISEQYSTDEISDLRVSDADDSVLGCCFVEAIHSIGEWKGVHRIKDICDMIWKYHVENDWYLCAQKIEPPPEEPIEIESQPQTFEDAIANL